MHAIILAGGFGTRLRHVVADVPKPLAPVAGRPFLAWLLESLARRGIGSATLSVHYEWEKIRDYFAHHPAPFPVDFAVEKAPLGTGGAMMSTLSLWERGGASLGEGAFPRTRSLSEAEAIFILNGDTFVALDFKKMWAQHMAAGATLSMALRQVPDTSRYGEVRVQNGIITAFGEGRDGAPGLINAGVYLASPAIFEGSAMPEAFSFERDFLPTRLAALTPRAFIAEEYFIDIGIPEDYARACRELPEVIGK